MTARPVRIYKESLYQCIERAITNSIQAKRRPSADIRLAGSQLSAGYSNEKKTRSATPRALTRSCVNAGTQKKFAQGQVGCQAAATKTAVKFDLVRAEQNVECEIYSYTPLMVANVSANVSCHTRVGVRSEGRGVPSEVRTARPPSH